MRLSATGKYTNGCWVYGPLPITRKDDQVHASERMRLRMSTEPATGMCSLFAPTLLTKDKEKKKDT
eukprot:1161441-Pelagomonas_calceolata.AAC.6